MSNLEEAVYVGNVVGTQSGLHDKAKSLDGRAEQLELAQWELEIVYCEASLDRAS